MNDIIALIPQRPPMVMIDTLLYCDREHTETAFTVVEKGLFVEKGRLSAAGLLENMAQTIAARMGYLAMYGPGATGVVRKGVIGAIRRLSIGSLPHKGQTLKTSVDLIEELGDMILVSASVGCNEVRLADCEMIVSLIQ